jgi:hypothetical protein
MYREEGERCCRRVPDQGIVICSWSRDGGKTRMRMRERERERNWEGEEEEESSALYCQSA